MKKPLQIAAHPSLKTRKQNIKELKAKHFDLLLHGSSPLAALTLLEATNRGLQVGLITETDFVAGPPDKGHPRVEILDSGADIFRKACCFQYGGLSLKMLRHAKALSHNRLVLKDLAPRSVKEEYYERVYSPDMTRAQRWIRVMTETSWRLLTILRTVFKETDSGVGLPYPRWLEGRG